MIKNSNAKNNTKYKLGLNEFADWSPEEYKKLLTFKPESNRPDKGNFTAPSTKRFLQTEIPDSLDWREFGVVSPVKNQDTCGSCYAFATVGGMEGAYKIKTGTLVEFSTQQLVDCSSNAIYKNLGCVGGNME